MKSSVSGVFSIHFRYSNQAYLSWPQTGWLSTFLVFESQILRSWFCLHFVCWDCFVSPWKAFQTMACKPISSMHSKGSQSRIIWIIWMFSFKGFFNPVCMEADGTESSKRISCLAHLIYNEHVWPTFTQCDLFCYLLLALQGNRKLPAVPCGKWTTWSFCHCGWHTGSDKFDEGWAL